MNTDVCEEQVVAKTFWTSFSGNPEYAVAVQCISLQGKEAGYVYS
jgi:hypothetical protein